MNTQDFTLLLQNPENLNSEHTQLLENVVNTFPYFQSARALYLKGLKNENSFKYNQSLKTTAAYTTDRSILFEFITSPLFSQKEINLDESAIEVIESEAVKNEVQVEETSQDPVKQSEEILEVGKPLEFESHESHSFNEWLQLGSFKTIDREEESSNQSSQFDIIDKFIATNPKIKPVKKEVAKKLESNQDKTDYNSLMTETLAKVYVEQKKYENAITAYRILSLKYPEKSGFFADRIKAIENLEKK